jgi:hypothetical protein
MLYIPMTRKNTMDNSSDEEDDDNMPLVSGETDDIPDPADTRVDSVRYLPQVDDVDDTMPDVPAVHTPTHKCWLCTFSPHPTAINMHAFIVSSISVMDLQYIASQIKDEIMTSYPHAQGASKRDIIRHIRTHIITPQVKIASTIRSLVTVAETLEAGLTHRDSETNEVLIDIKNTELFLKVVSQIMTAYKLDTTKLLFGKDQKQ